MAIAELFLKLYNHHTTAEFSESTISELDAIALLFPLNFDETGNQIKAILEKRYTDGISGFEGVKVQGSKITGVFSDIVSPTLTKKFNFTIDADTGAVDYTQINTGNLEPEHSEYEFAAPAKKSKQCAEGKSSACTRADGSTYCIKIGYKCKSVGLSGEEKAVVKAIVEKGKGKSNSPTKTSDPPAAKKATTPKTSKVKSTPKNDIPDAEKEAMPTAASNALKADKKKAVAPKDELEEKASSDRPNTGSHEDIPEKRYLSLKYEQKGENQDNWRFYAESESISGDVKQQDLTKQQWHKIIKDRFDGDQKAARSGKLQNQEKQLAKMAELANISTQEAKDAYQSINDFAAESYTEIRSFQRGLSNNLSSEKKNELQQKVDNINKYIENAPTYKGNVYRGMNFGSLSERDDFIEKIASGFNLDAISSFSSAKKIAHDFASGKSGTEDSPKGKFGVLLKSKNKSGVSISPISDYPEEEEVLVPKGANYKIKSIKKSGNMILVELDE